jgi:cysteinyl-tRNA synthetase
VKLLTLVFPLFLIISCNNSTSNHQTAKTRADSLMDEVMEGHNIGMAKMSKLNEEKNAIQQVLDSMSRLPTNIQKSSAHYKMQLDSAFNKLTFADHAMEKWMNEFNMDSLNNNKKEQAKYLESERSKISNVNEVMIRSLKNADSLLNKK